MSNTELSLPTYLQPFLHSIYGKFPSAFPSKKRSYSVYIDFSNEFNGYSGLYIDEDKQTGLHHFGGHQDRFAGGTIWHANAYDDEGESPVGTRTFEQWVMENIFALYDSEIFSVIHELHEEKSQENIVNLVREMSVFVGEPHMSAKRSYPLIQVLHAVCEVYDSQVYSEESMNTLMHFIETYNDKSSTIEQAGENILQYVFRLLPTPYPEKIVSFFYNKHRRELTYMQTMKTEEYKYEIHRWCAHFLRIAPITRSFFRAFFAKISASPSIAHDLAQGLLDEPEESIPYLAIGLAKEPDNIAMLQLLLIIYEKQGKTKEADAIRTQIAQRNMPIIDAVLLTNMQKKYTQLYKDFRHYDFFGKEQEKADKIVELEHQICEVYMQTLPIDNPTTGEAWKIAVQKKAFASSGSGMMMRRCVDQHMYTLCMDKLKLIVSNVERCRLQYVFDADTFEELLAQGIKAALDSQEEEFLRDATAMIKVIEGIIHEYNNVNLIYCIACVMARNNHCDDAIAYTAIAVQKGIPWEHVVDDSDLVNIHTHPGFLKLAPK